MMDARLIEFSKKEADDSVNAVHQKVPFVGQMMHSGVSLHSNQFQASPVMPKPLVVHYRETRGAPLTQPPVAPRPVKMKVPGKFSYRSKKAVPWKYN